jgi:hypothetical protein
MPAAGKLRLIETARTYAWGEDVVFDTSRKDLGLKGDPGVLVRNWVEPDDPNVSPHWGNLDENGPLRSIDNSFVPNTAGVHTVVMLVFEDDGTLQTFNSIPFDVLGP